MASYGEARRDKYRKDVDDANNYYRETGDLAGFQELNRNARMSWERDVSAHYRDAISARRAEFMSLHTGAIGERVYGTLDTGETVRIPSSGWLEHVSDTIGSPAEPPAVRLVGPLFARNESDTLANIVRPA